MNDKTIISMAKVTEAMRDQGVISEGEAQDLLQGFTENRATVKEIVKVKKWAKIIATAVGLKWAESLGGERAMTFINSSMEVSSNAPMY